MQNPTVASFCELNFNSQSRDKVGCAVHMNVDTVVVKTAIFDPFEKVYGTVRRKSVRSLGIPKNGKILPQMF